MAMPKAKIPVTGSCKVLRVTQRFVADVEFPKSKIRPLLRLIQTTIPNCVASEKVIRGKSYIHVTEVSNRDEQIALLELLREYAAEKKLEFVLAN